MSINTTTENIKRKYDDIESKMASSKSYFDSLKGDSVSQIETEERWLSGLKFKNAICMSEVTSSEAYTNSLGYVLNPGFPLKCGLNIIDSKASIHSVAVMTYGTNLLSFNIPNFEYAACAVPVNKTTFSIYSAPVNKKCHTESFASFLETATAETFLPVFIQTVFAIKHAKTSIGFTHYNLTPDCIRIKNIKTPHYILYDDDVLVLTDKIAVIGGFHNSHIYTTNSEGRKVSLGCPDPKLTNFGVSRDRVFPIADIYKLLITCAKTVLMCSNPNEELINSIGVMFKYFNKEEAVKDVIKTQSPFKYNLPPTEMTRGYNIEDFITFVSEIDSSGVFDKTVFTSSGTDLAKSDYPIYNPKKDIIPSNPLSFSGFFDIHQRISAHALVISSTCSTSIECVKEQVRGLTTSFIKGFTGGKSDFHKALTRLTKEIRTFDITLSTGASSHKQAIQYLKIFTEFRAFKYACGLYWKKSPSGLSSELPLEILKVDKILTESLSKLTYEAIKNIYKPNTKDPIVFDIFQCLPVSLTG